MNIRTPQADLNQASPHNTRGATGSGPATNREFGQPAGSGDTVTLTSKAAGLLKLEESLAAMPEIDSARIAAVKAAIADGSYHLDSEKIVDRLLSVEQDLS